jgi:16S rRNA (guanine527-N7)-methyltransferase
VSDPSAVLDPEARAALRTVLELLAADRASLSSVIDERAWRVHVEDSLTGLEVPELREARRIADIGAGAGFPGLALAAALPAARLDLVESVSRKCDFMRRAASAAGIGNVTVIDQRSEELAGASQHRESYDVVTARAVGRLSTLAELASPLLRDGGVLIAWKGKRDPDEEAELDRAAAELAMRPEGILDVGDRAGSQHRHLHVVRKAGPTPAGLPRRPGIAKKRPKGRT